MTLPTADECLEDPYGSNKRIAQWEREKAEAYREAERRLAVAASKHYHLASAMSRMRMAQSRVNKLVGWCMKRSRRCLLRAAFCRRRAEELTL